MKMDCDITVIGAGVIGLSISNALAAQGYGVILLEKEDRYGTGVSSRSSEVIHAGIYYQCGSLKASLCLRGKELLYEFCEKNSINHKRIGKLFLAISDDTLERLAVTRRQGEKNGVTDLVQITARDLKRIEPDVRGAGALLSPSTGIIDSHALMRVLFRYGKSKKVVFLNRCIAKDAEPVSGGWKVRVGGAEDETISSRMVVNVAGLFSTLLSKKIFPRREIPSLHAVKGCYAKYHGETTVRHIIYPAVIPGKIEERFDTTPDLDGMLRFGPSVEDTGSLEDYLIPESFLGRVQSAIKKYLPGLDPAKIQPDFSGIRPKIYGPGEKVADFRIEFSEDDGRWLDLWGIESPGLTSSLAIGEYVCRLVKESQVIR